MIGECIKYAIDNFRNIPTTLYVGMLLVFCAGAIMLLAFLGCKKGLKYSSLLLLMEYLILIISLSVLLRPIQTGKAFDLVPFWSYRAVLAGKKQLLTEDIANVLVYVPIGLLLGCAFGQMKWWKVLAIGGGFSLMIEVLQFAFKRGFAEFDDVFHNVLGCSIGFGVYLVVGWMVRQISPLAGARSK